MKDVDYLEVSEKVIKQIKKGAFLTVKSGKNLNTMTIGWATIGFIWKMPILMVAVRDSRHTYQIIEKANDFTVSVPSADMHDKIMFCGTKSGRDVNKFKELNLNIKNSIEVKSPIIDTPGIHFECKIVFKSQMDPGNLIKDLENLYTEKDYHTLYFGQILKCYEL